jgi:hypothetical protein
MSTAQFIVQCSAVVVSKPSSDSRALAFSVSKIRTNYRELRSQAEMCKLLNRKVAEQGRKCGICHDLFTDWSEIVSDHIEPRGIGEQEEPIIRITSRLCIDGASDKKARKKTG